MQTLLNGTRLGVLLIMLFGVSEMYGQSTLIPDGQLHTLQYNPNDKVQELKIPADFTKGRIYLEAYGADGGIKKNRREGPGQRAKGGQGARIGAWFEIGYAADQIPPGATILFIIGEKGQDEWAATPSQAGGGGGSGILFQRNSTSGYSLLLVAGGGGGGAADCCLIQKNGNPGEPFECVMDNETPWTNYGSDIYCYNDDNAFQIRRACLRAGTVWDDNTDAGYYEGSNLFTTPCDCSGQAGWPGSARGVFINNPIKPTGGSTYGECKNRARGGFGFGSGAPGKKDISAESSGGGGYTVSASSGGGSFIHEYFTAEEYDEVRVRRSHTSSPENGRAKYQIIPAPKAGCTDFTVTLPASETQGLPVFLLANNSTTSIPLEYLTITEVQSEETIIYLDCTDVGTQAVTVKVTGSISGYSSQCTANLTVKEGLAPVVTCKDTAITTNSDGLATFAPASLLNTFVDNCSDSPSALTTNVNNFTYDCSLHGQIVTELVELTATDKSGNSSTCTSTVSITISVSDVAPPNLSCRSTTINLNDQGQAVLTPNALHSSSSDDCGELNLQLLDPNLQLEIASDKFAYDVTWEITSLDGNTVYYSNAKFARVVDKPELSPDHFLIDLTLDAGCYKLVWNDIFLDGFQCDLPAEHFYRLSDKNGAEMAYGECSSIGGQQITEFCIQENPTLTNTLQFDCSDLGQKVVYLAATDEQGNQANCRTDVSISNPAQRCQSLEVQLPAEGGLTITADQFATTTSDECGDPLEFYFTRPTLTLEILSDAWVSDFSWDITSSDGSITYAKRDWGEYPRLSRNPGESVSDFLQRSQPHYVEEIPFPHKGCFTFNWRDPIFQDGFICNDDIGKKFFRLRRMPGGQVIAYGECGDIGAGQSFEFCYYSEPTIIYEDRGKTLSCDDTGYQYLSIAVSNSNGTFSSCDVSLKITPPNPIAKCKDIDINLNAEGEATITAEDINDTTLPCGGYQILEIDKTTFNCNHIGTQTVTLTVEDSHENSAQCTANVRVRDETPPQAICRDITASLDDDGQVLLDASLADDGSTDLCGVYDLYFSDYTQVKSFDCEDVGVQENYTIIVEDYSGNLSYCGITLTINDKTPPMVNCKEITISLDHNGTATITEDAIEDSSSDLCGVFSIDTDITEFSCEDLGENAVTLSVLDLHGNSSTCESIVTVQDTIAPIARCQDITVDLNENGVANLLPTAIDDGSNDNCGMINLTVSPNLLSSSQIGANEVQLTATDPSGNTHACTAIVTVNPIIVAYAWDDQDGDGKQDSEEPPLSGVPVAIIDHASDTTLQQGTTQMDGTITFSVPDISPSQQIKLLFEEKPRHRFTLKDQGNNDNIDSDVSRSNGYTKTFTVDSDGITKQYDAGLWAPGEVKATVWDDLDGDGKQDEGEPGLAGATVELLESDGTFISSTSSNSNGLATFTDVPADRAVKLKFPELPNLSFTKKDQGNNDNIDSDANRSNGLTSSFQANKGSQLFESWDAGMLSAATVLAYVWDDLDGDGKQDVVEPTIEGASVHLLESDNTFMQSAETDATGIATFTSVPTDRPVKLQFFELANHRFTLKDKGSNDNIDSDASRSNGRTATFQASTGAQTIEKWDAGLWSPGSVQASVWDDRDGDGKQDANEPMIKGVQVNLLESDGTLLGSTFTDDNGIATLSAVPANRPVKLQFTELTNFRFTLKDKGSNDNTDSDASRSNGMTATFQASKGQQVFTSWDAGLWSPGVVEALVWDDLDGDGKQDSGEPGVTGAEVHLLESNGDLLQSTQTDEKGLATFLSVPADRPVKLQFFEPIDHRFTLKDKGSNDNIDSDASRSNGMTATFQANTGYQLHQKVDAGLWSPGEIQALVWDDMDGDGKQDDEEPGLANAQVELLDTDNSSLITTTTDENGIATIFDVPANRSIKLKFTSLDGYSFTSKDKGSNDNIDSDPSKSSGVTASFFAEQGQQLFTTWDAGMTENNQSALVDNTPTMPEAL
ncbi:MAG: hypothetical protein KTR30_20405, partial [Saprospiraceae bacterium]|nr:hypothetical protein [Saprospiraceae bacterium]